MPDQMLIPGVSETNLNKEIVVELEGGYRYEEEETNYDTGGMKFLATIKPSLQTIKGEGVDEWGKFRIFGSIDDQILCFLKQYINCNGNATWSYTGKRIKNRQNTYGGQWGDGKESCGYWTLSVSELPENDN